jgi:hypothetical protein
LVLLFSGQVTLLLPAMRPFHLVRRLDRPPHRV